MSILDFAGEGVVVPCPSIKSCTRNNLGMFRCHEAVGYPKQPFFSFKGLAHHPIETTITPPPQKKNNMDPIKRWFRKKIGISASPFAGLIWSHPTAKNGTSAGTHH